MSNRISLLLIGYFFKLIMNSSKEQKKKAKGLRDSLGMLFYNHMQYNTNSR